MLKNEFQAATGLTSAMSDRWFDNIVYAIDEFSITSKVRLAAFLAQIGHESGGFIYTREIWGPTAAQRGYEGRQDLGNIVAGDGKRFLGRGLIMVTGRINYTAAYNTLGLDCIEHPELLEEDANAARVGGWWWCQHGCNALADSQDFEALTKRINGGLNGYDDRLARWNVAKNVLGA